MKVIYLNIAIKKLLYHFMETFSFPFHWRHSLCRPENLTTWANVKSDKVWFFLKVSPCVSYEHYFLTLEPSIYQKWNVYDVYHVYWCNPSRFPSFLFQRIYKVVEWKLNATEVGCNLNHPVVYCLLGVVASCFSTNISLEISLNIHFLCKLLAIHH